MMMVHNPFITPRKPPKPRKDREYKDGRVFKANKKELRRQVFERSGGRCEAIRLEPFNGRYVKTQVAIRCNAPINWENFHLAHDKHGHGFRSDTPETCQAKCENCHLNGDHGSKCNYPRRAGKVMTSQKAKAYWTGDKCFCDGPKPNRSSFCDGCLEKLPEQLRHDLRNTQWQDYLRVLAECETAILKHDIG